MEHRECTRNQLKQRITAAGCLFAVPFGEVFREMNDLKETKGTAGLLARLAQASMGGEL